MTLTWSETPDRFSRDGAHLSQADQSVNVYAVAVTASGAPCCQDETSTGLQNGINLLFLVDVNCQQSVSWSEIILVVQLIGELAAPW